MNNGHKLYELWEIFKDGKNGEIFEVVDCCVSSFIGKRYKVNEEFDVLGRYKTLVKADTPDWDDDENNLVTIYGCLGTAKYKKIEHFREITLDEAIKMLREYRTVYIKDGDTYEGISKYTSFTHLGIDDFADLFNEKFYIKENE